MFGTGSEMNNGAVITHEEKKIKGALWGAQADFAFLDPSYTLTVPMKQVISGAFDTLSHAMETYFGKLDENNLSDDLGEAVMRSVIRNTRVLLTDPENYDARSELAWASAMAENGILKIGKITDFQCHMIEHQLGAYTNCNHGAGLAVIHPVLYRHICKSGTARFARWAQNVWGIASKSSDDETASAGVEALAAFIKEIGLPTTFAELGIPADTDFRAIADSTVFTEGCCKKLTHDEIYDILCECGHVGVHAASDGLRSCGRGSPRVDRYGNVRSVRGTPYTQPKVAVGSRKGQIHAHPHGSDGVGRNHLSFYVRFND